MKSSLVVVGALVAVGASAAPNVFDSKGVRYGHGVEHQNSWPRDAEPEAAPQVGKRMMPCGGGRNKAMSERMGSSSGPSWAPGPLGALLSRLGFSKHNDEHRNRPSYANSAVTGPRPPWAHSESHDVEADMIHINAPIFVPEGKFPPKLPKLPIMEGGLVRILPIGDLHSNVDVTGSSKHGPEGYDDNDDDDDNDDHRHHHHHHHDKEHKHHKDHKDHHHHKDKHLKHKGSHKHGHKHHNEKFQSVLAKWNAFSSRVFDTVASLPMEARVFVFTALIAVLQVFFSLIYLGVRLCRTRSRECRRAMRRQRRDARRQAKAAYKAAKAAQKNQANTQTDAATAKEVEAGFAIEDDSEEPPAY